MVSPVIPRTQSTVELLGVKELGGAVANLEETPTGISGDFYRISLRDRVRPTQIMAKNEFKYASV